jgi:hypothetical protein
MLSASYSYFPTPRLMTCSTFLLRQSQTFLIGHNLDAPYLVPGVVVCNPRHIQKTSMSFFELVSAQNLLPHRYRGHQHMARLPLIQSAVSFLMVGSTRLACMSRK